MAEVRDQKFYSLWVALTRCWPEPLTKIEFRIYKVAESVDVRAVVRLWGTRPDGVELDWGLAITTRQDKMMIEIEGSIDMRTPADEGTEVFSMCQESADPQGTAKLIHAIASEVCSQRLWLDQSCPRA